MAVKGHKRVGLPNALSGEEDVLSAREDAVFWNELNMSWLRAEAIKEVHESFAVGESSWTNL